MFFEGSEVMDKKIQDKIAQLRLKGLGYKAIAAKLGVKQGHSSSLLPEE